MFNLWINAFAAQNIVLGSKSEIVKIKSLRSQNFSLSLYFEKIRRWCRKIKEQAQFNKVLSRFDVLFLAFGAMIGWGWVILAGDWVKAAGTFGGMVAFLLGGVLVCFVGLTYAELIAAMPKVGGEHVYTHRALGSAASFICTWAIILCYVSVVAFEAVALPTVVDYLVPGYQKVFMWTVAGWDVYLTWVLVGVAGSILLMFINVIGVKFAAFLQNVLTVLIGGVGILFITGSLFNGSSANMEPLFIDGWSGMFAVLVMTPLMYVGFNVIPQTAEEINLPYNTIGRVLILSVIMAASFYILIVFGVGRAISLDALNNASLVTADAMGVVFNSPVAAKILVLGGIGGILTSWNAFYIGGSRAIYALAKAGMLPSFLGKLHPKYKTPVNAVLLIGMLSTFAPLLGRKMLVWLVDAGGVSIVLAYAMVAASFLVLRYREPEMPRPFKVTNGKLIGYIALVLSIGMFFLYLPGAPAALVWPYEWVIVLGWTVLGAIFYIWARVTGGAAAADAQADNSDNKFAS